VVLATVQTQELNVILVLETVLWYNAIAPFPEPVAALIAMDLVVNL
tara:strand:- start:913 stop:1050 length:138 start_codon:yes stop_codon:yes gene_type:complete